MDRSKLIKVLLALSVLLALLLAFRFIFGGDDPREIALRNSIIAHTTIVNISQTAGEASGNQEIQALAADISSTTTSDRLELIQYYRDNFGAPPARMDNEAVEEVENAYEDIDRTYRETVTSQLSYSYRELSTLRSLSQNQELLDLLDEILASHESHLSRLDP